MTDNALTVLSQLADELITADARIKTLEAELKDAKAEFNELNENRIPDFMDEVGISEFTTSDGFKISVAEKLVGNISKTNEQAAHQWLADHGYESLLKNQMKLDFGKGDDHTAQEIENFLADHGVEADRKRYVHPQTLHAFLREKLADGEDIPLDLFGVFIKRQTKVLKGSKND